MRLFDLILIGLSFVELVFALSPLQLLLFNEDEPRRSMREITNDLISARALTLSSLGIHEKRPISSPGSALDANTSKAFQIGFRAKIRRNKARIFPYVVAGDTKTMRPEINLHREEIPPPIPDTKALEETINQIMADAEKERRRKLAEEAEERRKKAAKALSEAEALKAEAAAAAAAKAAADAAAAAAATAAGKASREALAGAAGARVGGAVLAPTGPGADAYINAGQAGVLAAAGMTTAERFGKTVGTCVTLISLVLSLPFMWFAFSGGALQLHRAFCACTAFYAFHSIELAGILNAGWNVNLALTASLAIGIIAAVGGYMMPSRLWMLIMLWGCMIIVVLFRVVAGPFAYVGLIPGPTVPGFYVVVILLGVLITLTIQHTLQKDSTPMQICNATIIGLVCALPVVSGISALIELRGKPANYVYIKFLSIPGTIILTNLTDITLTLLLIAITAVGAWLNYVRYKQFGLSAIGAAAESLVTADNP